MKFERKYTNKIKRVVQWLFYLSFTLYFLAGISTLFIQSKTINIFGIESSVIAVLVGLIATLLLVALFFVYVVSIFVEMFEKPKFVKTNLQPHDK